MWTAAVVVCADGMFNEMKKNTAPEFFSVPRDFQ
jgi:hypothetical protein